MNKPNIRFTFIVFSLLAILISGCGGGSDSNNNPDNNSLSTTYTGTQSPGDVWDWTIGIDGSFTATNQTLDFDYAGTYITLPSGFLQLTVTSSTDPGVTLPANAYALEYPNTVLFVKPVGGSERLMAATAEGDCLLGTHEYVWINIIKNGWDYTTDEAYGVAEVREATGNYDFAATEKFALDSTSITVGGFSTGFTCSNGVYTHPTDSDVIATTPSGALIADNGPGQGGAFGLPKPAELVDLAAVAAQSYRGFVFKRIEISPGEFEDEETPVGVEPALTAGDLEGYCINVVTNTRCTTTEPSGILNLSTATQSHNGLIRFTLVDGGGTHDMVAVINQVNGKYVLFGLSVDDDVTPRPFNVVLVQQ